MIEMTKSSSANTAVMEIKSLAFLLDVGHRYPMIKSSSLLIQFLLIRNIGLLRPYLRIIHQKRARLNRRCFSWLKTRIGFKC